MKEYVGYIWKDAPALVKKAAHVFHGQKRRCTNKKTSHYKWYGAKGIKQEYTLRQFIYWYLEEYKKIPKTWEHVFCGRIDHNKNYTLTNIRLEDEYISIKERNERKGNPNPKKKIKATNIKTGEVRIFNSRNEATQKIGACSRAMVGHINGTIKPRGPWVFSEA